MIPPVPAPTDSTAPVVSVVVATHNRAARLPQLVDALAQQKGVTFEAIVVDDASTDETWEELQRLATHAPFPLRPLRLDRNGGPGPARNAGWRVATATLVAFTDDDCEPTAEWLAALVTAAAGADVVQGATLPDPDHYNTRRGPFSYTLKITGPSPWFETCNMAYRRAWLEQLGGFDEGFRFAAGEDTDLGWRAREAGAQIAFASQAVVFHDVRPEGFLDRVRDARRWAGVPRLVRDHPQLRAHLPRRWFWKLSHPPALLAAAGLVAALVLTASAPGRWPFALGLASAAVLPYGVFRVLVRRLPGRVRSLPAIPLALVVDLAEIAVMARASWRYRTFVL